MLIFRVIVIVLLPALLLTALVLPVFAVDYNVGVSEGHYVKYGNFVGVGAALEFFNDYDWQITQVIDVSGKEVTLLSTGQFKNGTAIPGNGSTSTWNIETGTLNGEPNVQGPIIAADLNQGDPIPPPNTYIVNRTETRVYLGTSRNVNILDIIIPTPDYTTTLTYIYDKTSGMLLEAQSVTEQNQPQETLQYSYSVIETNIFDNTAPTASATSPATSSPTQQTATPTIMPTLPTLIATSTAAASPTSPPLPSTDLTILYLGIIAMTIAIIIVGVLVLRRRTT